VDELAPQLGSGHAVYLASVDVAQMRAYCLAKPGAWADHPWEEHAHPVIKVGEGARGKIFAFLGDDGIGVKAARSREVADEWLQRFPGDATVMAYIGRSGWNSLAFGGAIPDDDLLEAVDESYRLVVEGLPKKLRPTGWSD
jgi:predicted DNA-binding protein (MmcQ/YjbR family)